MKLTMRLYRIHDLDLLYLYKLPNFSLQKAIRSALTAYVKNEDLTIDYPETNDLMLPKTASFHIYLSEKDDAEVINWLQNISNGYRNSLLKNIVRCYLKTPGTSPYIIDNNILMWGLTKKPSQKAKFKKSQKTTVKSESSIQKKEETYYPPVSEKPISSSNTEESQSTDFDLYDSFEQMMSGL